MGGSIPQGGNGLGGNGGMQTLAGASGGSRTGGHGMPDTGSGGGGGGGTNGGTHDPAGEGGSGGNGTVIVRYPAEDYESELLLIAGGGGGGAGSLYAYFGGGGGAGGALYYSSVKLTAGKNYIVDVGEGGSATSGNYYIPTYTVGDEVYTPEAETSSQNVPEATAPDSDGDLVQVLGIATGANTLFFNPSLDVIEHAG